jgi:alkyl hydroperoxide reductase subunit F
MTKDWNRDGLCSVGHEPRYPVLFDLIIIGAGPAGMTAAVYAARRKMKILFICGDIGGQMNYANDISNWTGVAQSTGPGLRDQFFAHVKSVDDDNSHFDLWVRESEKVTGVSKVKDEFFVATDGEQVFKSKTVLCTTGKKPRTLNIPGEDIAMRGNGLSFAATQDAPLYKDKKMVVIGGGNSAMDVTVQLMGFAKHITVMTNLDHLIGESCLMEKVKNSPKVEVKYEVQVEEVLLDKNQKVRGVRMTEGQDAAYEFECEGIFEEIGQTPATKFLKGFVDLNDQGEIVTDRLMNTNVPGFFAAGDCNDGHHKQVIVSAGEGAVGALQAYEYLLLRKT